MKLDERWKALAAWQRQWILIGTAVALLAAVGALGWGMARSIQHNRAALVLAYAELEEVKRLAGAVAQTRASDLGVQALVKRTLGDAVALIPEGNNHWRLSLQGVSSAVLAQLLAQAWDNGIDVLAMDLHRESDAWSGYLVLRDREE